MGHKYEIEMVFSMPQNQDTDDALNAISPSILKQWSHSNDMYTVLFKNVISYKVTEQTG